MQSLKCGQCGSPDIEFLPGGFGRCRNCKTTYAPQGRHEAPQPPLPASYPSFPQPPATPVVAATKFNPMLLIIIGGVLLPALAIGGAFLYFASYSPPEPRPQQAARTPAAQTSTSNTGAPIRSSGGSETKEVAVVVPPKTTAELRDIRTQTVHSVLVYVARYVNTGETVITRPSATLSLFDANGKRLVEQAGYASMDWLEPGGWCVISVSVVNAPAHERAELKLGKPKAPDYESEPIKIKLAEWNASSGGFGSDRIAGTVRNESNVAVQFVKIIVYGLDAEGLPVSDSYAYATEDEIAPGGESGFQVMVTSLAVGPAAKYQVQAVAMKK